MRDVLEAKVNAIIDSLPGVSNSDMSILADGLADIVETAVAKYDADVPDELTEQEARDIVQIAPMEVVEERLRAIILEAFAPTPKAKARKVIKSTRKSSRKK